jgi:ArsR family metal-binding transcriptional regulator
MLAAVSRLKDEIEARTVLDSLKELINNTYERRDQIEPSYKTGDELKVMDIYKLLPGTNCKECGEPTCFAFANKIVRQEADVSRCAPLYTEEHSAKRQKLLGLLEVAGYL